MASIRKRGQNSYLIVVKDRIGCFYSLLWLPDGNCLWIGPFLLNRTSERELTQMMQAMQLPPQHQSAFREFYHSLTVLSSAEHFDQLIATLAETLYGAENYHMNYLALSLREVESTPFAHANRDFVEDLRHIEQRYAHMKAIIDAVAAANTERALQCLEQFLAVPGRRRFSNPAKEQMYWLAVFNTTMRNTAWAAHVPPYWLDKLSHHFASWVESLPVGENREAVMRRMVREYCALVREHAQSSYSALVQRVILLIDFDLSANLSLRCIAEQFHTNASYLSNLFRKEVGVTLTEYVNKRRMAQAVSLLENSELQIQSIAQLIGIMDLAYFARLFKKYLGCSPSEYRKKVRSRSRK